MEKMDGMHDGNSCNRKCADGMWIRRNGTDNYIK